MIAANTETKLPSRIHFKHGSYYYVKNNKWTRISARREDAISYGSQMNEGAYNYEDEALEGCIRNNFNSCRAGAKKRGLPIEITLADVINLSRSQGWLCALTGIRFSLEKVNGSRRRPFAPSIDRINPSLGYVNGNIRMVCLAVNLALNEWGDYVFFRIAHAHVGMKV